MITSPPAITNTAPVIRKTVAAAFAFASLSCSQVIAQTSAILPYDHFDPVFLNEYAASMVKTGDRATGLILLERAARLAPFDPRIVANLNVLREQEGGEFPLAENPTAPHPDAGDARATPNLPPPWKQP